MASQFGGLCRVQVEHHLLHQGTLTGGQDHAGRFAASAPLFIELDACVVMPYRGRHTEELVPEPSLTSAHLAAHHGGAVVHRPERLPSHPVWPPPGGGGDFRLPDRMLRAPHFQVDEPRRRLGRAADILRAGTCASRGDRWMEPPIGAACFPSSPAMSWMPRFSIHRMPLSYLTRTEDTSNPGRPASRGSYRFAACRVSPNSWTASAAARHYLVFANPVTAGPRFRLGFVLGFYDVTEQKELQRELIARSAQLTHAHELMADSIAIARRGPEGGIS
jgi:hypothetical protein